MNIKMNAHIVHFCAEECERQRSGEVSVARMIVAYQWALDNWYGYGIKVPEILMLASLVDDRNAYGWRSTPVYFADNSFALDAGLIPRAVDSLISAWDQGNLSHEEFYQEFERIHPFVDGNGRVGAIVYNWIRGRITTPEVPPEFFT